MLNLLVKNMQIVRIDMLKGKIWLNGELVEWEDAKVHILTHSMHYASSVFEGLRVYNGKIFKLKEHIERLLRSAQALKLHSKHDYDDIFQACIEVVEKNEIKDGYVRPLIWRGAETVKIGAVNNSINSMVAAWEVAKPAKINELSLCVAKWRKPNSKTFPVDIKSSGNYTTLVVSQLEALENGYDDAIMLDENDYIAECTTSNIFFVKDKEIVTPKTTNCLNGITRQTVIEIARQNGYKVAEADITLNDIPNFEGCFITGTASEIKPVTVIHFKNQDYTLPNTEVSEFLLNKYREMAENYDYIPRFIYSNSNTL